MDLSKFDEPLNEYVESLSLSDTQDQRVSGALQNILSLMLVAYPDAEVYAQGSYSTDTLTKPLTATQGRGDAGEYDVDIAIEREAWTGGASTLEEVEKLMEEDGVFGQMTIDKTKNSCVRIVYAADGSGVGFHIDLVPTKLQSGNRFAPNREDDSWKPSDTKKSADWFNGLAEQNERLRSVVLVLKRIRDLQKLDGNLKSILILTLAATNYYDTGTLMGDLVSILDEMSDLFEDAETPPFIANPVNEGENLADTIDDYHEVRTFLTDTASNLKTAIGQDDAATLKSLFGPGFRYVAEVAKASALAAASTIEPVRAYGTTDASSKH